MKAEQDGRHMDATNARFSRGPTVVCSLVCRPRYNNSVAKSAVVSAFGLGYRRARATYASCKVPARPLVTDKKGMYSSTCMFVAGRVEPDCTCLSVSMLVMSH